MHNFRDKRKSLKRSRPEFLEQQEFGEIMKLAVVRDGQHGPEPLQVHIGSANLVPRWNAEAMRLLQSRDGLLFYNLE